jgi:Beta/Gamma crystallin
MEHVILFEHQNLHGRHKHIFQDEPNLGAPDDNSFNKITSSVVVLAGTWEFFMDPDFNHRTGFALGPGLYPSIADNEIEPKAVSSLRIHRP